MAKRNIYLTEKQLEYIKERLLNEISIYDKYGIEKQKGKTNLDYKTYTMICSIDPTSQVVNNQRQTGKYCNWLLQRVDPEEVFDLNYRHRIKVALEQYNDGVKRGILKRYGVSSDIGSFKTVDSLMSTMQEVMGNSANVSVSTSNAMEKLKGQYEIIGESPNWYIVIPKTFEAERFFGSHTEWCTVANSDYFNGYTRRGPLYITFPKNGDNKLKMQFHFSTNSFASYDDEVYKNPKVCIYNVLGDGDEFDEVCGMWKKASAAFANYTFVKLSEVPELLKHVERLNEVFDYVYANNSTFITVGLNGRYNVVKKTESGYELLSPNKWFYNIHGFFNNEVGKDSFVVEVGNERYNALNANGELLFNEDVINLGKVYYGWAVVRLDHDTTHKWNYINEQGQLLLTQNVFNVKDFDQGYGKFAVKGYGWNLVRPDGKIVFDRYFRDVYPALGKNGQFIVELGTDTYDVLREDGTSLTPNQKYMNVRSQMEYNGYVVKIKGTNGGKNDYIFSNDLRKNEERDLYYLKADGTLCYMYDVYHEPRPIPQEELDRMGIKIQQPPQEPNTNDYLKDRYELRQGNLQESKSKKVYFTESQIKNIKQRLLQARKETNTNPTEKQKEAGNYKMGRVNILGFDIAIENPKGSYRRGKDRDGKEWKTLMHNDYGYFTHTLAIDGDAVDVFLGDNFECKSIFAIDQKVNGKFDETKVMLGFNSEEEAKNAYLSNYEKDWKGFWRITEVTIELFKKWLYNGYQQRKPFSEYVEIKKKKLNESNSNRLLTENFDDYYMENDVMSICNDFVEDMRSGRSTQNWRPLINPAMYQKALQVFTKQGNLEGFPEKYVYQWIGILMRNTIKLDSNTELAGHSMGIDYDGIENSSIPEYIREKLNMEVIEWGDDCVVTVTPEYIVSQLNGNYLSKAEKEYVENFKESMNINEDVVHTMGPNKGQMAMFLSQPELDNYDYQQQIRTRDNNIQGIIDIFNYHNSGEGETRATMLSYGIVASLGENGMINLKMDIFKLLDLIGLYDWMQMPDGSDAWSDFGLRPLFEILAEFDDYTTTPEQALVLVNKALDVSHQRGDMPSIFIEGGSNTLWKITNSGYVNEAFNHWVQDWEIEQIKKFAVDGKIKLYHNTTTDNLEYIVSSGELDAHQHHSEGHGDWLWFSVRPDRWENKCKISIEVPVKEFLEDKKFRFMNTNDVITEDNISIYDYNFNIEKVDGLYGERIIEILTGNDERLINYLLSKFFDDISCIKSWFLQRID